ncbi:serine hydrolase family protein [Candidatus Pacearchaeota archaeon]|nr:serine hydrolase family protein [Candidatus Pacearchaeota archaeon]
MKKLILIHGWGGSPISESWFDLLRKECEDKNIDFIAPEMPNTDSPRVDEWISKLREVAINLDEETYFVGHSMGCQTIIRYLSEIDSEIKVGRIVFVAPWTKLNEKSIEEEGEESEKIVKSWEEVPIDFGKAKSHLMRVLAIFSDNDPYVLLSETKVFGDKLGAEIIIKHDEGHFNETKEINEIMEFIER